MQNFAPIPLPAENLAKKRLYLIDGYGFVFRAFHALPPIKTSKGVPTGAVYGFANMLIKLRGDIEKKGGKNYLAVIFDSGGKTFRDDMYDQYKANRAEAPDDLRTQFPLIRRAAEALNIPSVELENYEADDLIAAYVKLARAADFEVVIVSSDKDLMQLITDGVKMLDPVKYREIGEKEVLEKFGVPPAKVADVLALIGDSSDNVPGVRGIGPKTAAELINEYGSLENLLENIGSIKQQRRAEMLQNNIENARLSKRLVLLDHDAPVPAEIESFPYREQDNYKLSKFFQEMEFRSLLARLEKNIPGFAPAVSAEAEKPIAPFLEYEEKNFTIIREIGALKSWLLAAKIEQQIAISLENIAENKSGLVIGYTYANRYVACLIEFGNAQEKGQIGLDFLDKKNDSATLSETDAVSTLQPLLENESILKIGHSIKELFVFCRKFGVRINPLDDIMLLSNVLDSTRNKHDLETLARLHLQTELSDDLTNLNRILYRKCRAANDLQKLFRQRIFAEKMTRVYELLERPLVEVLAEMEKTGILVDRKELAQLSEYFNQKLTGLEKEIYAIAGQEFNIGSPKQLSEILFGSMGFSGGKKTKSGAFTTGADALEILAAQGHDIAKNILEWRQFSKLKSTYSDALQQQVSKADGRVHTTYAMAATSTGRLSSINPNLQNIPIKSEEGRKIRRAFIAAPGQVLIAADYSQIELRLLAHMADIPALKKAFAEGLDIHNITANQVFGVPVDQVDAHTRRMAKTINFGIIYGQSAFGLARQLGIPRGAAQTYIDAYFAAYPGILEYMERTKSFARENGFVVTLFGRKCHILGMSDRNQGVRGNAERAAINAPLQGTAADIIKLAMVRIFRELRHKGWQSKILLQVHDELIFESPETEAESLAKLAKKIMENAAIISVPLTVDVKTGANWGEVH